jgi:hypothetical protein
MNSFRLDGFDGVGGTWKIPSTDETFDARYGRWKDHRLDSGRTAWQAGHAVVIASDTFAIDDT